MNLTSVTTPAQAEFDVLKEGLNSFNQKHTGTIYREKVSSFIKSEDGTIYGGILGDINWGWMYIEGLWVSDEIRQKGWGAKLLSKVEQYALINGVGNFRLETTSFQALEFYQKQGYEIYGELQDMPPGFTSYFLKKQCVL